MMEKICSIKILLWLLHVVWTEHGQGWWRGSRSDGQSHQEAKGGCRQQGGAGAQGMDVPRVRLAGLGDWMLGIRQRPQGNVDTLLQDGGLQKYEQIQE